MKIKFLFATFLSASIIFSGCSKDDDAPGTITPVPTSMTAKLDGTDWEAPWPTVYTRNGIFSVGGMNTLSKYIVVGVRGATATGTYKDVFANIQEGNHLWLSDTSGTATLTITKLDTIAKKASGTFSFTAIPSSSGATGIITVTNGIFTEVPID